MNQRLIRVQELIKRELGGILQRDNQFPGLLVTITGVDVTPDLKHAYVYVGVVGQGMPHHRVVEELNANRSHLQKQMARRVVLKHTPHIIFRLDDSAERGVRLVNLIEQLPVADEPGEERPTGR
jgi:ribosome-binding factor A